MHFINTTIYSFNLTITTALSALKNITPTSATARLTSVSEAASSAFASQEENSDASTSNYRLWVATLFTSVLFIAATVCFCRRKPPPALPQQPPANSTNIASSSSSKASCSSDPDFSLIQTRDFSGNPIDHLLFQSHSISRCNYAALFNESIFIFGPDFAKFNQIAKCEFTDDRNFVYIKGNYIYITYRITSDPEGRRRFLVRKYNDEKKQIEHESYIDSPELESRDLAAIMQCDPLCFELIDNKLHIVGGPRGVVSITDNVGSLIFDTSPEENEPNVTSIKNHGDNIFAGLENGTILKFNKDAADVVESFKVDPATYDIKGRVTSLQIVENHLFALYCAPMCDKGEILVWNLKADQTQTPVLLTSTNIRALAVANNGLLITIDQGIIRVWHPSTLVLVKEFNLSENIQNKRGKIQNEESYLTDASVTCRRNAIIVTTQLGYYHLPLPVVE